MESTMDSKGKKMQCEAHTLLVQDIERVKNNESQLYELDRERQKKLSDIQSSISKIQAKNEAMENDISELKQDMATVKKDTTEMKGDISEIKTTLKNVEETTANRRWQPKDWVAVIVAVLALLGTCITALVQ